MANPINHSLPDANPSSVAASIDISEGPISYLPEEMLINIFSNLSPEVIAESCRGVCKRWKRLSDDQELYKVVEKRFPIEKRFPWYRRNLEPQPELYREAYVQLCKREKAISTHMIDGKYREKVLDCGELTGIQFVHEQNQVVIASSEHQLYDLIKVWNLETGECEIRLEEQDLAREPLVTADGKKRIAAHTNHTITVRDLATGEVLHTLAEHIDSISGLEYVSKKQSIVSLSQDHTIKVWDLHSGICQLTLPFHHSEASDHKMTPDGKRIILLPKSPTAPITVWNLETGEELIRAPQRQPNGIRRSEMTPDGKKIVLLPKAVTDPIVVLDLEKAKYLRLTLPPSRRLPDNVCFRCTSNGKKVIFYSINSTDSVAVVDLEAKKRKSITEAKGIYADLILTPNEQGLIAAHQDRVIRVWDLTTGVCEKIFESHASSPTCLKITPNGKNLIAVCQDDTHRSQQVIKIWDFQTGAHLTTLPVDGETDRGMIDQLFITPDGSKVIFTRSRLLENNELGEVSAHVWDFLKEPSTAV